MKGTIYLERNEDGAWSNVPIIYRDQDGLDWGNSSPETVDLAVNILHWALDQRGFEDQYYVEGNRYGEAFAYACIMAGDFVRLVLSKMPYMGGKLTLNEILQWIDKFPYTELLF